MRITIITDGACSGNPGPGGWAAIVKGNDTEGVVYGNALDTTNNRMELMAVLSALKALTKPCDVTVISDSAYIVNQINGGFLDQWAENDWRNSANRPVKNSDLWQAISEELKRHNVSFQKVKGHAGDPDNERADQAACKLRDLAKAGNLVPFQKRLISKQQRI